MHQLLMEIPQLNQMQRSATAEPVERAVGWQRVAAAARRANEKLARSNWTISAFNAPEVPWKADRWHAIVEAVRELRDGWCGPGSVAPTNRVRIDLMQAMPALRSIGGEPEVEVDPDGTVALLWQRNGKTVGLTFVGNGTVVGTVTPQALGIPSWSVPAGACRDLSARLSAKEIATIIS